jgi:oxygen-independent coproporphyrinogen-3 oxidase
MTGMPVTEKEILSAKDVFNDYVITRLRRTEGIDLVETAEIFGEERAAYCLNQLKGYVNSGHITVTEDRKLRLSRSGIFIADAAISRLLL